MCIPQILQGATVLAYSMTSLFVSDRSSQLCILAFLHELRISLAQLVIIYSPLAVVAVLVGGREPVHTKSASSHVLSRFREIQTLARKCSSLSIWHRSNKTAPALALVPPQLHPASSRLGPRPFLRSFAWIAVRDPLCSKMIALRYEYVPSKQRKNSPKKTPKQSIRSDSTRREHQVRLDEIVQQIQENRQYAEPSG